MNRAGLFGALAIFASLAASTPASIAADALTPSQSAAVVDRVVGLIGAYYVFPEKRQAIIARIRADQAAGNYAVSDSAVLADRLRADLLAASGDKHLWVKLDPQEYAGLLKPFNRAQSNDYFRRQGQLSNEGYDELKILPGNVRYADVSGFEWNGEVTARTIGDVARFLAGGDAVIIDIRHNGGGSPQAVQTLVSYFLPPDNRELMRFDGHGAGLSASHVLSKLPAPRMVGKPLYVLTSATTGSAAEEFAYHVKLFKLGTLVGETTAGAGNNDTLYPIAPGFVLSVSTGRPIHPVSGTNWDGVGVVVDDAVPAADALNRAQLLALQTLAAHAGADTGPYDWAMGALRARLQPVKLEATALGEYAGSYGERRIWLDAGQLMLQRTGGPRIVLSPMAADLFAVDYSQDVRLRFRRSGGRIVGYDNVTSDGQVIPVERTG